ncbi:MAG: type II toxin-antitoxin system mRNA interferase toxin, RelE/StbE family [Candidatus Moranbacteria bacterium]|nr:type II toxin-antitoxin system mRNA interferase toxin, RelE/StbE family [Candidatus Moranbacteria bacterium]
MKILYLPKFAKQYKKLPLQVKLQAEEKEKVFRNNPFDKSLKTHKLKGELVGFWSFSINYSYRIIFDFQDEKTVRFYYVGDHSIYK